MKVKYETGKVRAVCLLVAFGVFASAVFLKAGAQQQSGGFTGSGTAPAIITVAQTKNLQDDAPVTLKGSIVRSLGNERYLFKDNTGTVTVEIENKVWRGLTVNETDVVEISGEVEKEWNKFEVEVKNIKKL